MVSNDHLSCNTLYSSLKSLAPFKKPSLLSLMRMIRQNTTVKKRDWGFGFISSCLIPMEAKQLVLSPRSTSMWAIQQLKKKKVMPEEVGQETLRLTNIRHHSPWWGQEITIKIPVFFPFPPLKNTIRRKIKEVKEGMHWRMHIYLLVRSGRGAFWEVPNCGREIVKGQVFTAMYLGEIQTSIWAERESHWTFGREWWQIEEGSEKGRGRDQRGDEDTFEKMHLPNRKMLVSGNKQWEGILRVHWKQKESSSLLCN